MTKSNICTLCNKEFIFSQTEKDFFVKFKVPEPWECFMCQLKQMMAFWPSIWKWNARKCDFSWEKIVTNYSVNSRFPVYKKEYFNSDKWEVPFLELDMNKSFFTQVKELQEKTPRPHQLWDNLENCLYCDDARNSKNCYLASSFLNCENLYYSYRCLNCKDCSDLVFCWDSSMCVSLVFSKNCFKVSYSVFVNDSSDSLFLYDCQNVKNCFMSWNLRNAEYCIKNKKYSKEEYYKELEKYDFWSRKQIEILQKEFEENIKNEAYYPENRNIMCENVSWNFLTNSKNIKNSFLIEESEDSINLFRWKDIKNSLNVLSILECDKSYLINMCAYQYNVKFSSYSIRCKDSEYLDNCTDLENCFLCVWLKNKKYYILNKEYTQKEYEELIPKIKLKMWQIWEYWKFFPYSMMYTDYNSTIARLYFPETKENIEKLWGYYKKKYQDNLWNIEEKLPDNIKDIELINNQIETICLKTWKKFNYIWQVVELYKNLNSPIFSIFHLERIVNNYTYLTWIVEQQTKCYISWKQIKHYYNPNLSYKKVISNEEYQKIINS